MILNSAKRPEIICYFALNEYYFNDDTLVVGDEANKKLKLPDIHNTNNTYGIEVVQLEKDCDFKINRVWKLYEKYNGDYDKIKSDCDLLYPNEYILTEYNGLLGSFYTNGGAHSIDWMKDVYKEEIDKKLVKLNNGNYSSINGNISLCISILQRRKRLYDVNLILYQYFEVVKNHKKGFDKIFVLTSDKMYILKPENVKNIQPKIWQNCIVDFDIEGNEYFVELDYDYNDVIEKTNDYYNDKK